MNGTLGQKLTQREPHIGRVPHFVDSRADTVRQALPTIVRRGVKPNPATLSHRFPGIGKSVWHSDSAIIVATRPGHVPSVIEWRKNISRQLASFFQHGINQILRNHVHSGDRCDPVKPHEIAQGKFHIVNRCLIHSNYPSLRHVNPATQLLAWPTALPPHPNNRYKCRLSVGGVYHYSPLSPYSIW